EAERPGRGPVGAVGADDRIDLDPLTVDADLSVRLDLDADAVPERRARIDRLPDEELVEPPALRHQAEDLLREAFHHGAVLETAAHARDPVLNDGLDRNRELPHGARRQTAAARLVAREFRLVY